MLPSMELWGHSGLLLRLQFIVGKQSQNGAFCCRLGVAAVVHLNVTHLQFLESPTASWTKRICTHTNISKTISETVCEIRRRSGSYQTRPAWCSPSCCPTSQPHTLLHCLCPTRLLRHRGSPDGDQSTFYSVAIRRRGVKWYSSVLLPGESHRTVCFCLSWNQVQNWGQKQKV